MTTESEKKTIKIQTGDLVNAQRAMTFIGDQRLPPDRVMPYMQFLRVTMNIIEDYTKRRTSIIRRYSNGGNSVPQTSPAIGEISDLLGAPIEVPDPEIKWEMVKDLPWVPNDILALVWMIPDIPL